VGRRIIAPAHLGRVVFFIFISLFSLAHVSVAAPYAAMVMDARNGKILHSENADTRLHPASLTKMMTLYITFQAIENGEISLDTNVRISKNAAAEPPSKLGLRSGQQIKLRYLIRAAAIKSANDAATALGEAIEGSEAAFARRMNRTAKELGMTRSTFKNANGLTANGHLSTAHDMTILGRHLFYDFPDYYNLFSRITEDAGIRQVANTNRRFLGSYKGADGIKTGYTRAAGFNLVASAERNGERIITTVFGGRSSATRNAQVAKLMDLGFKKAPSKVAIQKPNRPSYQKTKIAGAAQDQVDDDTPTKAVAGKTVRLKTTVAQSVRPKMRPGQNDTTLVTTSNEMRDEIRAALEQAQAISYTPANENPEPVVKPEQRPAKVAVAAPAEKQPDTENSPRVSTSDAKNWGINVGRFASRYAAEKMLLKTALAEIDTLDGSLRKVQQSKKGFEATFVGLSKDTAELACRRLTSREITCTPIDPR
jgi:D-alanyl-D-alanine carboxypeptidase